MGGTQRLVVLLGMSPGVLHTVLCVLAARGLAPREIHVVATGKAPVSEALEIARSCPCPGAGTPPLTGREEIHTHVMSVDDVVDERGIEELKEKLEEATRGARDAIIDVTGGRKLSSIIAAMFALRYGYTATYTPIPPEEQNRINRAESLCGKTARIPPRLVVL